MVCQVCGRTVKNEEANFCDYCGASFREMKVDSYFSGQKNEQGRESQNGLYEQQNNQGYGQGMNEQGLHNPYSQNQGWNNPYLMKNQTARGEEHKSMSVLSWLGIMALPFIPYIGSIIFLVILVMWSTKKDIDPTKKNWAKAMLIITVICLIFVAVFFKEYMGVVNQLLPSNGSI